MKQEYDLVVERREGVVTNIWSRSADLRVYMRDLDEIEEQVREGAKIEEVDDLNGIDPTDSPDWHHVW